MTEEILNNGFDKVNKPNHYCGRYGMESIDIIRNFAGSPEETQGFYWGMSSSIFVAIERRTDWKI